MTKIYDIWSFCQAKNDVYEIQKNNTIKHAEEIFKEIEEGLSDMWIFAKFTYLDIILYEIEEYLDALFSGKLNLKFKGNNHDKNE